MPALKRMNQRVLPDAGTEENEPESAAGCRH